MIRAETDPPLAALAGRLARRGRALALAAARRRRLARRADDRRWRRAGLLWPLFTKG